MISLLVQILFFNIFKIQIYAQNRPKWHRIKSICKFKFSLILQT
ncbi:hypothetical protein CAMSH0001_1321 [Campylobacter showae RM3277]|uniref:Uncharacterized protein n=1 Tax=Campylobacter showae RM3277 TaxID=553219 RepID=C6RIH5_9BACT|nr:hypothetical protein CAMSH0001_1321 [Campylobacter showae RM3277]